MSRAVAVAIAECGCAAGGAAGAAGPIGAVLVAVLGIAAAGAVVVAAAYAVMAIVAAVALLVALAAATAVIAAAGAALTVGGVHLARLCRARWDATAAAVEAAPVTVRVEMVHSMDGTTRLRAPGHRPRRAVGDRHPLTRPIRPARRRRHRRPWRDSHLHSPPTKVPPMTEHPPPENLPTVAAMLEALDDDDDRRAVAELVERLNAERATR
jgi:hypothetical protein